LDFTLPEKYICLLTDDGDLTTAQLAQSLTDRSWKVVVLSFPQSLIAQQSALPEGITRIVLEDMSEEHLKQQLASIAESIGPIGAFIHLNPVFQTSQDSGIRYFDAEKAIVKHVFLMAKYLKKSLNEAASEGRSCFYTIAHLDGVFGLGQNVNFAPIGAGLFGLTKSLNFEWESVFCRAIDLNPTFDPQQSVEYIIAELHDPNRNIAEVGYGSQGRATLVAER